MLRCDVLCTVVSGLSCHSIADAADWQLLLVIYLFQPCSSSRLSSRSLLGHLILKNILASRVAYLCTQKEISNGRHPSADDGVHGKYRYHRLYNPVGHQHCCYIASVFAAIRANEDEQESWPRRLDAGGGLGKWDEFGVMSMGRFRWLADA